ncbi:MAG: sulfatase [Acidobacteria bacterium]|nr:sulfatase [Acidobacteriota bacterium]
MRSAWTRTIVVTLLLSVAIPVWAQTSRPNIIFIFSDDHAYQAISAYGSRINHTPNIDRIAREGMRFENAMVTNSICAPSRAVIQTGKYSHLNGVLDNMQVFDGSQQTFPKLLQQAGYQTAVVGKWHLKSEPTGFDYWEVLPGQGAYYNPDLRVPAGQNRHAGYVTDIITDLTLNWLEHERDPDRPFMVMSQHKAPHRGWMPGPERLTLYDGMMIPEPDTLFDDYANRASPARLQEMEIGRHMIDGHDLKLKPAPNTPEDNPDLRLWLAGYGRLDEGQRRIWDAAYEPKNAAFLAAGLEGRALVRWKYQRYIKDYLRTIASVDDNVGRLLRYLDETGLAENTIVVYSSDQGFYLGEHGWFDKRWMYEESLKTPLLVRWPGVVAAGSTNTDMVSNLDFPATLLNAAGVDVPHDMQGRSFVPMLRGETPADWRKSFYYHYYEKGIHNVAPHEGVRTERHKLIHYYETDEWELFDLEVDPNEIRSVYGAASYAETQAALLDELGRLKKALQVPDIP